MKILPSLNLNQFDIIDLDAYGVPFDQLDYIFSTGFEGVVCVTMIGTFFKMLPKKLLLHLGYSEEMIKKAPVLCCSNGLKKMFDYLEANGVRSVRGLLKQGAGKNKNYFWFTRSISASPVSK